MALNFMVTFDSHLAVMSALGDNTLTMIKLHTHIPIRHVVSALFILLLIIAIISQHSSLQQAFRSFNDLNYVAVAAAIGASFATYLLATLNYQCLSFVRLPLRRTLVVQLAALCVNRILPSGLGALGVNFAYLRRNKHTLAQATTVVSVNNMLGFVSSGLLVLAAILSGQAFTAEVRLPHLGIIAVGVVVVLMGAIYIFRKRFVNFMYEVFRSIAFYKTRTPRLAAALGSSLLLTLANTLVLFMSLQAIGINLSFWGVLIAVSVGVGVGAAVPTPGGIGGVEAGTAAALIAYDVPKHEAIAAALLFRIITYWLGLAIGAIAFAYVQRKHYIG